MKIKCIINDINDIQDEGKKARIKKNIYLSQIDVPIGKEFVVYGIVFWGEYLLYYIDMYNDMDISPVSAELFEITDPRISSLWRLVIRNNNNHLFVFKEWAESETFYENYVDGDRYTEEWKIFKEKKDFMDKEFS